MTVHEKVLLGCQHDLENLQDSANFKDLVGGVKPNFQDVSAGARTARIFPTVFLQRDDISKG